MSFLLARILLLLALSAACGALFAWWWLRRHYEDVTLDYTRSRAEWSAWRGDFEARLASRPGVDLAPLERQLMAIEHALAPVETRLDALEGAVRAIRVPAAPATPLLEPPTLQSRPDNLTRMDGAARTDGPAAPKVVVREGSRNLLTHAGHGEPDDLKRIRGVARVLERTLHRMGVFYFWQIAEWSPEDVRYVDSRLTAFRGRIERDDWVHQASKLAATPTAAARPTELEQSEARPGEAEPRAAQRLLGH